MSFIEKDMEKDLGLLENTASWFYYSEQSDFFMVVRLIIKVPISTRKLYCCSLILTCSSHNCLLSCIVSL